MFRYVLKRIGTSLFTLWVIITITFILMHSIPGDPLTRDKKMPEAIRQNIEAQYHLNEPLWKQYGYYFQGLAHGELGPSLKYEGVTVNEIIGQGFPVSAQLGLAALVLMLLVGLPAGVISALRQNQWQDHTAMFMATLGVAVPNFVLATLLIYIFGVKLELLPTSRWVSWQSVIMPAVALAFYPTAYIARLTRSSMLEVIGQDYIRTARAKGLPQRTVLYKHALRNALVPIVTYLGPLIAGVLTGSFVIEKIFAIPGLGQQFVLSISNRDYTTILGVTIFYAAFLIFMNLVVDLLYGVIDPRIRLGK
ncbi:MAG: ABC transporter permease [Syntrophomonadaceae bacterium]|jgi:oligopeptide transport system permease protein|nr:ABC transporter permease [Syntrophomonadaceae bacterium]